ncbi:MAG: carbohydrate ABC transporter permease [Paenibacillaceae bacterium]|nr:carbohydrate ABC transporter permease [Paenibacillaceae bacterium]
MVSKKWFDVFNIGFLVLLCGTIIVPFLMMISQSLMSNEDIARYGYTLLPKNIVFYSYKYLLVDNTFIYRGFAVSVFVTVIGTLCNLLFTCSLAYALSKKYLPWRNGMTIYVLITMFFSGGLIPAYLLVINLGMKDSLWALIIPGLISPWYMFLMRNFFMEIPREVEESAYIDGANDIVVLSRIIIPMSLPSMATIGLFYAVSHWNSWFSAAIYLNSHGKWPLQLMLREMITSFDMGAGDQSQALEWMRLIPKEGVKAAAILIVSLPIICVYPFLQKYFVKGMTVGSLKG